MSGCLLEDLIARIIYIYIYHHHVDRYMHRFFIIIRCGAVVTFLFNPSCTSHDMFVGVPRSLQWSFFSYFPEQARSFLRNFKLPCKFIFLVFQWLPTCSMYGIFTYIWLKCMVNESKCSIHGAYGLFFP